MTSKSVEQSQEYEGDVPLAGARPVRLRRGQKRTTARSRKTRRKTAKSPGGIHQRANRRMSW